MKSCLYNCEIYHDRRRPKVHAFNYRVFMFCIDLDEVHLLDRNPLIGHWPGTIYSLRATDHLQSGASSIRENLIRYLRNQGYTGTIGSIRLVTHLDVSQPACRVASEAIQRLAEERGRRRQTPPESAPSI